MDPNSYTNADPTFGPAKVYAPVDALGETATNFTVYTLVYRTPPRQRGITATLRRVKEKFSDSKGQHNEAAPIDTQTKACEGGQLSDEDILGMEERGEIKLKFDPFYDIPE